MGVQNCKLSVSESSDIGDGQADMGLVVEQVGDGQGQPRIRKT